MQLKGYIGFYDSCLFYIKLQINFYKCVNQFSIIQDQDKIYGASGVEKNMLLIEREITANSINTILQTHPLASTKIIKSSYLSSSNKEITAKSNNIILKTHPLASTKIIKPPYLSSNHVQRNILI
jgi:hypothetical protein